MRLHLLQPIDVSLHCFKSSNIVVTIKPNKSFYCVKYKIEFMQIRLLIFNLFTTTNSRMQFCNNNFICGESIGNRISCKRNEMPLKYLFTFVFQVINSYVHQHLTFCVFNRNVRVTYCYNQTHIIHNVCICY